MNAVAARNVVRPGLLLCTAVLLGSVAMAAAAEQPSALQPIIRTSAVAAVVEAIGPEGSHAQAFDEVFQRLLAPAGFQRDDISAFQEHKLFTYALADACRPEAKATGAKPAVRRLTRRILVLKPSGVVVHDRWSVASEQPDDKTPSAEAKERVLSQNIVVDHAPGAPRPGVGMQIDVHTEPYDKGGVVSLFTCHKPGSPAPKLKLKCFRATADNADFDRVYDFDWTHFGGQLEIIGRDGKALLSTRLPGGVLPHSETGLRLLERWDSAYRDGKRPGWDTGRPSSDLAKAVEQRAIKPCRVVELGCGSGTNAIYLASKGFDVTAVDIAPTALAIAAEKAKQAKVNVTWVLADVLNLPAMPPTELIYDRGCYHGVRQANAAGYVETARKLSLPGTRLLIHAGNANEQRQSGPPRVKEAELRGDFEKLFDFQWLRETRFDTRDADAGGALAWSAMLVRKPFPSVDELPSRPELPDPLTFFDGSKVRTPDDWYARRRPELKALFQQYVYGYAPPAQRIECRVTKTDKDVFGGKATLKQVEIRIFVEPPTSSPPAALSQPGDAAKVAATIHLALFVPNKRTAPAPVFLGLNKCGNHTVAATPSIAIHADVWRHSGCEKKAGEAGRGAETDFWCVEYLIDRGYALATFHESEIDPDRDDFTDGVHPHFSLPQPVPMHWGTIAAWAWGLQRAVDYLATDPDVDRARIALTGHSRRGKTALLAAAFDERVALVVPHQSGTGGMALSRANDQETVERINKVFPHWFNDVFPQFAGKEDRLPVDQHLLAALVAPRLLLDTEGKKDKWANFDSALRNLQAADRVWKFLGRRGLAGDGLLDESATITAENSGQALQYRRDTPHTLDRGYWEAILDFADAHMPGKAK